MNRIRKGDQVIIIAGADKGKKGEVVRVAGDKVVVQNVNIIKRHTKPNPQANVAGGIVNRLAILNTVGIHDPALTIETVAERFDDIMAITPDAIPQIVAPAQVPATS